MRFRIRRIGLALAGVIGLGSVHAPHAHAADPVRGKWLYEVTNGAPMACANSGCHGTNVALNKNKILRGANNGPLIMTAISKNAGGMGFLAAYVNATDAADIGAYIANPAAGTAAPAASVAPASLAFPSTVLGAASANQTVTLSNPGTAALSVGSIATSGANAVDFAVVAGGSCAAGSSVPAGGSCSILVRFQPTASGSRSATLAIAHNASGGSSGVSLSGTATIATQPSIAVSTNTLAFPATALGTSAPVQTVSVANVGGASMNFTGFGITGAQAGEFARAGGGAGGSCAIGTPLAAGASCTVGISFAPAGLGTRSATLTISSDAANGNPAITLSGTGEPAPAPVAQLAPASHTFGDQTIGTSSPTRRVLLANLGNAPMSIAGASIVGASAFVITGNGCGATLAAGASCAIDLSFAPTAAGPQSATLRVADDAAGSPHTVGLSGNGVTAPVGSPTLAPSTVTDYGEVLVGQRSPGRSFTIGNAGSADFTITSIATGGADASSFAIEPGGCAVGQPLAPSSSCSIAVVFAPAAIGARTATLEIGASSGSLLSADLRGSGMTVAAPAIDIGSSTLDFGVQPLNGGATQRLTLTNSGTAVLQVTEIAVTAPFALDAFASTCPATPFTLAPGAGCELTVAFSATVAGEQTGQITIVSNASATPKSVALAAKADGSALVAPVNLGAGGCTTSTRTPGDPSLPLLALIAAVALLVRRRPRQLHPQTQTGERA